MTPIVRRALVAAACAFALFAGWRIVGLMQAERYATSEPERALRWRPHDPRALQALAERQLKASKPLAAEATARTLLTHEPLSGTGFRILAAAADRQGRRDEAFALYRIAARRAPRDLETRAWLTQRYLEQGRHPEALQQIDRILRMAPQRARSIDPVLVQLARDPAFADALADVLRTNPPWRAGTLTALRNPPGGDLQPAGVVLQALQDKGGLSADEYAGWLDSLIAQGRWGEAYARWAGAIARTGARLPPVFNGDFELSPSNAGFDWRLRRVPGVLLEFVPAAGANGTAAYLRFIDRRVPHAGLEQALMLGPGRYRLQVRIRAQALRNELGLQWVVDCAGNAGRIALGDGLEGSFAWRTIQSEFTVPPTDCPGQWLRLVNPVADGAAQRVVGELWVDDVKIQSQP